MRMRTEIRSCRSISLLFIALLSFAGCLAHQVAKDGNGLRQVLIDLYTDQAMDNLIRAHENRPFVQLAYTSLDVHDVNKCTATAGSNELDFAHGKSKDLTKAIPAISLSRSFMGKFLLGGTDESDRTISFHADPITDRNYVYEKYLAFASNPQLFSASGSKPCCPVCISRKWDDKWFWVPCSAASEFQKLILETSLTAPEATSQIYWDTTVVELHAVQGANGSPGEYQVTLHDNIPNDYGLMAIVPKLQCKPNWLPVVPFLSDKQKTLGPQPEKTQTIVRVFSKDPLYVEPGTPVRLFLNDYPNPTPRTPDNQKILDSLDSIRILLNNVPQNSGL